MHDDVFQALNRREIPRLGIHRGAGFFQAAHHAGEGFHQRGVPESGLGFKPQQVLLHHACRNDNGLGIRPVQEQQILAQIIISYYFIR